MTSHRRRAQGERDHDVQYAVQRVRHDRADREEQHDQEQPLQRARGVAHAELGEVERALVEALHPARERQRRNDQQDHAQRGHARLDLAGGRERALEARRRRAAQLELVHHQVGEVLVVGARQHRGVDDQQRDQRRVGLRAECHRAIDALDLDEAAEPVAGDADHDLIVGGRGAKRPHPPGMTRGHPGARDRVGDPTRGGTRPWHLKQTRTTRPAGPTASRGAWAAAGSPSRARI